MDDVLTEEFEPLGLFYGLFVQLQQFSVRVMTWETTYALDCDVKMDPLYFG